MFSILFISQDSTREQFKNKVLRYLGQEVNSSNVYIDTNTKKNVKTGFLTYKDITNCLKPIESAHIIVFILEFQNEQSFSSLKSEKWLTNIDNAKSDFQDRILVGQTSPDFDVKKFSPSIVEIMTLLHCNKYYEEKSGQLSTEIRQIGDLTISNNFIQYVEDQINDKDFVVLNNNYIELCLSKRSKKAKVIYSKNAEGDIEIPENYMYNNELYIITSIGSEAFMNNKKATSLSFAKDSKVKTIGNYAFENSSIRHLTIPSSLEILCDEWCNMAKQLKTVEVVDNEHFKMENGSLIKDEVEVVFCNRDTFGIIAIPNNIKVIKRRAFYECKEIKRFVCNSPSICSIEPFAFYGCAKLESFEISSKDDENNIEIKELKLGSFCFSGCEKLESFTIVCKDLIICDNCFNDCTSLWVLYLQYYDKLVLEDCAFMNCTNIKQLLINVKQLVIKQLVIYDLKYLYELFLKSSHYSIEDDSISNCPGLKYLYINSPNNVSITSDQISQFEILTELTLYSDSTVDLKGCTLSIAKRLQKINLKTKNLEMNQEFFKNLQKLQEIQIDTLSNITFPPNAFENCDSLKSFIIQRFENEDSQILNRLTFEHKCFNNLKNLNSVKISGTFIKIEHECFKNCVSLESFAILDSRTSNIESNQFVNCLQLKKIDISVSPIIYENKPNLSLGNKCFYGANNLEYATFSGCVLDITNNLFYSNKSLALNGYLYSFPSLVELTIKKGVIVNINKNIFYNCNKLVKVSIESQMLNVNENSFNSNKNLELVSLGVQNIEIGDNCFNNCSLGIKKTDINETNINETGILFSNVNVLGLGTNNFCGCENLSKIDISSSQSVSISKDCFNDDKNLQKIKIHSKSITIGRQVFKYCPSLISVKFVPLYCKKGIEFSSVGVNILIDSIEIGKDSFADCPKLKKVIIIANKKLKIEENCFGNLKSIEEKDVFCKSGQISIISSFYTKNITGGRTYISDMKPVRKLLSAGIIEKVDDVKTFNFTIVKYVPIEYQNFNSFYIFGIKKEPKKENEEIIPSIISMFPSRPVPVNPEETPVKKFYEFCSKESIENFSLMCYPHGIQVVSEQEKHKESNIISGFVISALLEKLKGVVLQVYIPPDSNSFIGDEYDHSYPFCLCLMSNNPEISLHFKFLCGIVDSILGKQNVPQVPIVVPNQLQNLKGDCAESLTPLPNFEFIATADDQMILPSFLLSELLRYYVARIPTYCAKTDYFLYPTLQTLCTFLKPAQIVYLFFCLMCEFKIVFYSSDSNKASFCVLALVNLIKGIDITVDVYPIVPNNERLFISMAERLGSPVLGTHKKINDTDVLVDVDEGTISLRNDLDVPDFPDSKRMTNELERLLEENHQLEHEMKKKDELIYPDCFDYFVKTRIILTAETINKISDLFSKPFVKNLKESIANLVISDSTNVNNDSKDYKIEFRSNIFLEAIPDEEKPFMRRLIGTMMFKELVNQIILEKIKYHMKSEFNEKYKLKLQDNTKKRRNSTSDLPPKEIKKPDFVITANKKEYKF